MSQVHLAEQKSATQPQKYAHMKLLSSPCVTRQHLEEAVVLKKKEYKKMTFYIEIQNSELSHLYTYINLQRLLEDT